MERLAIIGSGVAGLGCAHFLKDRYDLTIFEAGAHVGGHANTVDVDDGGEAKPVDTGFMVYNEVTYPLLTRLFSELDVDTRETSMSFSVQHRPSGIEWNGDRLSTLFAQRKNLLNLRHWKFLFQLNRFNTEAVAAIEEAEWAEMTLGEYVEARGYGQDFMERYLIPMSSAVWSTPPEKIGEFPAMTLLRFWFNHGFLGLKGQHQWRTVVGGSREYVRKLIVPFEERIHLQTPVTKVEKTGAGVAVTVGGDKPRTLEFDRVIMAAHADHSLAMLAEPSALQQELLSLFAYQDNDVDLHTDRTFMPEKKLAWASWNYRSREDGQASTHYWMNSLQGVSEKTEFFVSLNTRAEIAAESIRAKLQYEHPLFDMKSMKAQSRLPELNADGPIYFCGSYFRYGFHEDALKSAYDLCTLMLEKDPWDES